MKADVLDVDLQVRSLKMPVRNAFRNPRRHDANRERALPSVVPTHVSTEIVPPDVSSNVRLVVPVKGE